MALPRNQRCEGRASLQTAEVEEQQEKPTPPVAMTSTRSEREEQGQIDATQKRATKSDSSSTDGSRPENKLKRKMTEEMKEEYYTESLQKALRKMEELRTVQEDEVDGLPFTWGPHPCIAEIFNSFHVLDSDEFPKKRIEEFKKELVTGILKFESISIMFDILVQCLKSFNFLECSYETISVCFTIMGTLVNFSDCSGEVREKIVQHHEALDQITKLTKRCTQPHFNGQLSDYMNHFLDMALTMYHNCSMQEELVPTLRDLGLIQLLLLYLDSPLESISLICMTTLADLVNEKEAEELLQTHLSIFQLLIETLGRALDMPDHRDQGWSAEELVRAMRRLARNDANSTVLVNEGCLPSLLQLIAEGSPEERKGAAGCMWALSFHPDNKAKMVHEEGLVSAVHNLYRDSRDNREKDSCYGILWSLRENLLYSNNFKAIGEEISSSKGEAKPKLCTQASWDKKFQGHVMMSYQWDNQKLILKIVKELRAVGIPVWVDVDNMEGSILEAMGSAVENAFAVVIAVTQKYKDSSNTRAEAEYAFKLKKEVIPLVLQKDYRADGWLGIIMGSKLFYDFSGQHSFRSRMDLLLKAVGHLKGRTDVARPLPIPSTPLVDEDAVRKWTLDQKRQWLGKYSLESCSALLDLCGEEILFLYSLRGEAPESFFRCLETKLHLTSLLDISKAFKALADLSL